jgi:DNA-binding transcriptional regulator LsrR (DeoR family)
VALGSHPDLRQTHDPDIDKIIRLIYKEPLTLTEISHKMNYPVATILYMITKISAGGYTIFAHPTEPTTFSFIPPKENG